MVSLHTVVPRGSHPQEGGFRAHVQPSPCGHVQASRTNRCRGRGRTWACVHSGVPLRLHDPLPQQGDTDQDGRLCHRTPPVRSLRLTAHLQACHFRCEHRAPALAVDTCGLQPNVRLPRLQPYEGPGSQQGSSEGSGAPARHRELQPRGHRHLRAHHPDLVGRPAVPDDVHVSSVEVEERALPGDQGRGPARAAGVPHLREEGIQHHRGLAQLSMVSQPRNRR